MINPEYLTVSASTLRKNPWNTNIVSADNEAKIRESITRNGLFKPIIVREVAGIAGYEIIGGEHRWEQAIELGHTDVPIVNLGQIDDRHAKEIGIIDNARYGADDTVGLGDILKELGNLDEIQSFLPYGDTDLKLLFTAGEIDLDALGDEATDAETAEAEGVEEEVAAKPVKTHTVVRFKISLSDAERVTALVAKTQKTHGYTTEDELTNAGDALIHILSQFFPQAASKSESDDDFGSEMNILDELDYALEAK
ncbi:hypothetical protein FHV99_004662 [Ochrobactrum sp. P20RRXII]|nr:ParB/RepB/Spo0J family partition protein [Ochrobactrum sp. P20RRXII]NIH77410.1 hypothetical protein [Ochrobactrum sp. P20RRXII]